MLTIGADRHGRPTINLYIINTVYTFNQFMWYKDTQFLLTLPAWYCEIRWLYLVILLDQHFGNYDRKVLNLTNRFYCNDRYCDISVIVKYYYHKDASSQVFL